MCLGPERYEKVSVGVYRYRYNGKELNPDLNLYDYGARWYDPAIARFTTVDPLADQFAGWSPYNYVEGNPIANIDPDGRSTQSTIVEANEDGTYSVIGGNANDGDNNIYVVDENGQKSHSIGESLTSHSFFGEDGEAVLGAVIDPNSTEGQNFIDGEVVSENLTTTTYAPFATGGKTYDFKVRGIDDRAPGTSRQQHVYRGSRASNGKFGSARDFGNAAAGLVAARDGMDWGTARLGFDALESWQEGSWSTEGFPTQKAQRLGFEAGQRLRKRDSYSKIFSRAKAYKNIKAVRFK